MDFPLNINPRVMPVGKYTGLPVYALRFQKCKHGCFWCPYMEKDKQQMTLDDVRMRVRYFNMQYAHISGGGFFDYDIEALINFLKGKGLQIIFEHSSIDGFTERIAAIYNEAFHCIINVVPPSAKEHFFGHAKAAYDTYASLGNIELQCMIKSRGDLDFVLENFADVPITVIPFTDNGSLNKSLFEFARNKLYETKSLVRIAVPQFLLG